MTSDVDRRSLELRLLGPMEALVDGVAVPVSGPRRRAVLIRLALSANETVSKDRLIDDLWGERPPPTAAKALQVQISQLRDLLRLTGGMSARDDDVLVTRQSGYMLRLEPDSLDISKFEQGYAAARQALEQRQPARAGDMCRDALALWRGPALVDVSHESFALTEAARIEELRMATIELRIEADLAGAGHVRVIGELETLVDRHPFREHLWSLLALALYRSGRHAEAVRACTRLRDLLRDELGLEPSLEITRLEHQIIVQDPALDHEAPGAGTALEEIERRGALGYRTNLPRVPTPFIGGVGLLKEIDEQVQLGSLVTLTGPGGVGKTRAAIEFARCHLDDFDDGVYFVDLAPVTPGAVVGALAAALPLMVLGEQPLLDMIVDWIGDRRSLLVVDNCEHLVAEVVGAIEELITRCWNLKVLATSREALRLTEERVYCVPSLEAGGPALELFCERARAVDASFAAEGHVDALVRICERLDGIPLAIELAAARVRSLSVDDLLDRVDDRFRFLRGRTSATLDRHHTLWDTISWSYQLLTAEERVLFDRASVFAGGFDLHAAEAVCGFDPIDAVDIFELVSSLVDKSMIVADRGAMGMRYRQLETLRQYAEEQLEPRGETALLRDRHAAYVADLAAELDLMVRGPHQIEGEDRMALEWDNIRAAHTWSLTQGDLERAQRLVEATFQCSAWGMGFEHVAMLQRTVQLGEALGHPSTTMLGMLSYWTDMQGNGAEAQRLAQRGLDVAPAPDHPDTANCWWALCAPSDAVTAFSPEAIAAFRHQTEAVANTPDLDRNWWALVCLTDAALNSDRGAMGALLRQLDEIAARVQCPRLSMMTRLHEGHAALEASAPNFEAAMSSYKDAAVIARATADRQCLPLALRALAIASTGLGAPEAVATCHDSLEALFDVRHWQKIWQTLEAATLALARAGRTQQAAEILGCLDARSPGFGIEHALHFRDQARQLIESAGGHDAAQLRGARMSPDEVVTIALTYCSDNG